MGVDLDPQRFASFINQQDLKIHKCDVEVEKLPFQNDAFHFIIFNEIFEHLRINPIKTLKEINRLLHPDGVLMLSTPNLYSINKIVKFNLGKGFDKPYDQFEQLEKIGHMGHVREYSVNQVKIFLDKTGFTPVETQMRSYKSLKGIFWAPFNLVRKAVPAFRSVQIHLSKKK